LLTNFQKLSTVSKIVEKMLAPTNRIRLPGSVCAALGSLSVTHLIFCITGFVSAINETCQLTCVKIFSDAFQQNRRSGFDSIQRKGWEPLMKTMKRIGDSTYPCQSPTPTANGCA